jgi:hypothetical protein
LFAHANITLLTWQAVVALLSSGGMPAPRPTFNRYPNTQVQTEFGLLSDGEKGKYIADLILKDSASSELLKQAFMNALSEADKRQIIGGALNKLSSLEVASILTNLSQQHQQTVFDHLLPMLTPQQAEALIRKVDRAARSTIFEEDARAAAPPLLDHLLAKSTADTRKDFVLSVISMLSTEEAEAVSEKLTPRGPTTTPPRSVCLARVISMIDNNISQHGAHITYTHGNTLGNLTVSYTRGGRTVDGLFRDIAINGLPNDVHLHRIWYRRASSAQSGHITMGLDDFPGRTESHLGVMLSDTELCSLPFADEDDSEFEAIGNALKVVAKSAQTFEQWKTRPEIKLPPAGARPLTLALVMNKDMRCTAYAFNHTAPVEHQLDAKNMFPPAQGWSPINFPAVRNKKSESGDLGPRCR